MWLNKINILFIIFLAGLLRFISLNQGLWWDEAINVVYARQSDFLWFITKYPLGDFHPPGWFAILWIWGNIFGWSEIAVRMPSVIFGLGTVYLTYLIGKELFSKKIGILSALMLSLAPLHIYYSQEARMYAFSTFAVSFSIYSLILLINKKKLSWLIFVSSIVLILYSDYVAYFIFPIQFLYLLFFEKKIIKIYLSSIFFSLIFFIPVVFILPQQILIGQKTALAIPGWEKVVGGNSINELILLPVKILIGKINFNNKILYYSLIVLTAIPFLFIFSKIKNVFDKKYGLVLMWLIAVPILAWIFSFYLPVFSFSRFIFIIPAFYIAVVVCLYKFSKPFFQIFLMVILIFELAFSCLYLFNNNFQREDWRGAIKFISQNSDKQTLIVFENKEIATPAVYYGDNLLNLQPGLSDDFAEKLSDKKKVFLFEYLNEVYDPKKLVIQKLLDLNFTNTETYDFRGIGFVRLYVR